MGSIKYESLSIFCQIALNFILFTYFLVMLSITSAEVDEFRKFNSKLYTSDERQAMIHSVSTSLERLISNPIYSIYMIQGESSCNASDSAVPLYYWNTKTICVCPHNSQFSPGSCPEFNKDCYTTSERQLNLFSWKGSRFCTKRIQDWYKRNSESSCDLNYIMCPNNICIKKTLQILSENNCPITSILVNKNMNGTEPTSKPLNHSFISNFKNESYSFWVSKTVGSEPIYNLAVEINDSPCIFELEAPIKTEFQLLKAIPNGCNTYGNDKSIYQLIDDQKEWDFYVENNIPLLTEDIKNIYSFAVHTVKLFTVNQIKINCEIKSKNFNPNDTGMKTLRSIRSTGDSIAIIMAVMGLILFFIHLSGMIYKRNLSDSITLSCHAFLLIFLQAIISPIALYDLRQSYSKNKFVKEMIDGNCFEVQGYNKLYEDLARTLFTTSNKVNDIIYTILYYSLIMFLICILYVIDKLHYNNFFDPESGGTLEEANFNESCFNDDDCILCD